MTREEIMQADPNSIESDTLRLRITAVQLMSRMGLTGPDAKARNAMESMAIACALCDEWRRAYRQSDPSAAKGFDAAVAAMNELLELPQVTAQYLSDIKKERS